MSIRSRPSPDFSGRRPDATMPIELRCSGCGRMLQVADEHAGRRAACPICQAVVTVPLATSPQIPDPAGVTEAAAPQPAAPQPGATQPGAAQTKAAQPGAAAEGPNGAETEWSLRTPEGREYGPVLKSVLDQWVIEGRVTHDCELRLAGDSWQAADQVYPCLGCPPPVEARPPAVSPMTSPAIANRSGASQAPARMQPVRPAREQAPQDHSRPSDTRDSENDPYVLPDRGVLVVSLAILGWLVCPILSVAAWAMATADLNEMRRGRMDRRGYGLTQAGRIMAILHVIAIVVGVVVGVFAMLVYLGASRF